MSGNKSFARSMNGINNIEINEVQFPDGSTITSASNLVQLDTTNDFTSNNSFNNNLPTSTKTPEVGDLTDVMILNKYSADLLYSGTDENDYPTAFTRNGTTGEITLTTADTGTPLTGDTTFTSITDEQILEIGVNTNKVGITPTQATAISNNTAKVGITTTQATAISNNTAKVGITTTQATAITNNTTAIGNAVLKTTAQTIGGIKTFSSFPIKSGTGADLDPTADNQFATKQYVDDNGGAGSGDAVLSAGTTASPQTFTGVNAFNEFPNKSGSGTALNPTADNQFTTKKYVDDATINHSFHASFTTPNAGNMFFDQGIVFKPTYIWFNIGNCYNSSTGKFTATARGVYMFKFSAFTNQASGYISRPSLYKNGVLIISSGNTIAQNGNQVFAIITLDIGDAVHLTSAYGRYYMYSNYAYNQFSGSIISTY